MQRALNIHPEPFRFLIRRDRDGRCRWYLFNAFGTVVARHPAGFPNEREAHRDVEQVQKELAIAPIFSERDPKGKSTEVVASVRVGVGGAGSPT